MWIALTLGCGASAPPAVPGPVALFPDVIVRARQPGGEPVTLAIHRDRFVTDAAEGTPVVELDGYVVPGVIDSHVHLTYFPVGPALRDAGVVAAVDLAAPISSLAGVVVGPMVVASGPMITAVRGYPTTSWGAGGYGIECADAEAARAAVADLVARGAKVIKVPLDNPPTDSLPDEAIAAVVEAAHAAQRKAFGHALTAAGAARGAALGVDGLAHTPVELLPPDTVAAWEGRIVLSTLRAFGGSASAIANLTALRDAGAIVLYGTDLGNTRDVGIDPAEVALLEAAGLDGAAILDAMTAAPATVWGLEDYGALSVGKLASFLVLDADPLQRPSTLATPSAVWIAGRPR